MKANENPLITPGSPVDTLNNACAVLRYLQCSGPLAGLVADEDNFFYGQHLVLQSIEQAVAHATQAFRKPAPVRNTGNVAQISG